MLLEWWNQTKRLLARIPGIPTASHGQTKRFRPRLEEVEPRIVPAGTWTRLTNAAPSGVGTMILLSNGTVIAQEADDRNWQKLTPNSSGSYLNGTWSTIAPM